jgi:NADPH-dependent ferric siderophore reductase
LTLSIVFGTIDDIINDIGITSMSTPLSESRVQRVRHEIQRRPLEVVRTEMITPHFKSITFAGDSLADFTSESFDDHVKFILKPESDQPVLRDYTPRSFNRQARELTIEFALHAQGGPTAQWAIEARSGDRVTVAGPRGSFIIPLDYDWHLLVGDETALPAISRRLEELPSGANALVLCQVKDILDRREFASAASLKSQWVNNSHDLIEAVRQIGLPSGEGYAWCAGEAGTTAALRRVLVDEMGHSRHAIRAAAYWKSGTAAHHQNLED